MLESAAVFDHLGDAVVLLKGDRVLYANKSARTLVGLPQLENRSFLSLIAPDYNSAAVQFFKSWSINRQTTSAYFESAILAHPKQIKQIAFTISHPKRAHSDSIDADVLIIRDITPQKKTEKALKKANEKLKHLTITDSLTGLYNRRYLMRRLHSEFARSKRYHTPLSVLMIDVDHFKQLNDTYGHPGGDYILKEISDLVSSRARGHDVVARYGGEELTLILPQTKADAAHMLAETLRQKICHHAFQLPDHPDTFQTTISIGIACYPLIDVSDHETLLEQADQALYRAKSAGRNCVVAA